LFAVVFRKDTGGCSGYCEINWSFEFFCDIKDAVVPAKPFRASFSQ
jgi:hypothetical protein